MRFDENTVDWQFSIGEYFFDCPDDAADTDAVRGLVQLRTGEKANIPDGMRVTVESIGHSWTIVKMLVPG
mgnify:CR=1 FL=1